jgi:hypothetical protein
MKLLTKEILRNLPRLTETEGEKDPLVIVKFFYPDFSWTWYAIEFDGKDIFYGYVAGDYPELGYFSLSELQQHRGKFCLPIERDMHFEITPLSNVRAMHE